MSTHRHPRPGYLTGTLSMTLFSRLSACAHVPQSPPDTTSKKTDEEVPLAYGTQPQDKIAGSASSLKGDTIQHRSATQIEELIRGQVAGVQVRHTPSGGFKMYIRGIRSFYGSNESLYVVDGTPVHVPPGRGIDWLSPHDIERIDILKDAGTTASYGMRAADGVVLITTRRGR